MSKLRFYLDENVANEVAEGLRTRGIDVLTTPEAGNMGYDDRQQLIFAREQARVVITQDRDFLRMAKLQVEHTGIVYWRPQSRSIKHILRELLRIHRDISPEDMANRIEFL